MGWQWNEAAQAWAVNLNRADAETLQTLDGVGEALAQDIIAARPFASLSDVSDRVTGIGQATVDGWGAAVVVSPGLS